MDFAGAEKAFTRSIRHSSEQLHVAPGERERAEAEIAGYIAQMSAEMMAMASRARLDLLAYLLSIARIEAEVINRRSVSEPP
jgi:hypothetical protein